MKIPSPKINLKHREARVEQQRKSLIAEMIQDQIIKVEDHDSPQEAPAPVEEDDDEDEEEEEEAEEDDEEAKNHEV